MTRAYFNEFDPYAAAWLRNLIAAGHLPAGDVDERSIVDVSPSDVAGYSQVHWFAGIGGWGLAARLAGWPDDRELWTGSAPCQPFSVAGQGKAQADDRHLWPHLFSLASARRPAVLMGEQVAAAVGKDWLDGVFADLEGIGYACGAAVVPACAVDAPHRRDRLWFVAHAHGLGGQIDPHAGGCAPGSRAREVAGPGRASDGAMGNAERTRLEGLARHGDDSRGWTEQDRSAAATCRGSCGSLADTDIARSGEERQQRSGQLGWPGGDPGACDGTLADASGGRCSESGARQVQQPRGTEAVGGSEARSAWDGAGWIIGHDGKARRVEPGIRLLAHGLSARVGRLRAYGNAICVPLAAEIVAAYMDCRP